MMLILSREEDLIPYERNLNQQLLKMGGRDSLLFFVLDRNIFEGLCLVCLENSINKKQNKIYWLI